jgi:D-3-phosphoglycerate dehydrogenase
MKVLFVAGRWAQQLEEKAALQEVAEFEMIVPENQEQIAEKAKDIDIIITSYAISGQVMRSAKRLKMIQVTSVGYENIDMEAAAENGVVVCNVAEANANSVAELAFGLIIDLARRISAHDRLMRAGGWSRVEFERQTEIHGKTLGIIGLGAIGSRMAQIGYLAFNMKIIACDPYITGDRADQFYARLVDMDTVFREADIVTVHVPLSKETYHLVKKRHFDLMKPTAFFISTPRGPVVDEEALIATLRANKIAGAGLDVFEVEPLPKDSPLRSMENVVIVPHIGSTWPTLEHMRKVAVENVIRVAKGLEPFRIKNLEVYYRSPKWFPK